MEGALSVDGPTAVVGGRVVYAPVMGWLGRVVWKHGLDLAASFGPVPTSLHARGTVGAAVVGVNLVGRVDTHLVVPFLESVLIASVLEKVLFRGVIFHRWAHARKRPAEALLAASVLFALVRGLPLNSFVFGAACGHRLQCTPR
jgi:membrane protease YdiL (CAAX protease family)